MRALLPGGALLTLLLPPALLAQGPAPAPKLQWAPAPAAFPKGAEMAVVSGDPGKAGVFTIELSMPGGYRIPPHFHPTDEKVEIKKGTFLVGMGDKLDLKQARPMVTGDTGTVPAKAHHYAATKGATIVAVTAMGPFAMTYVNPKDDPQNASAGY
jgi:quercetin dioxygenase-like cupin family protein